MARAPRILNSREFLKKVAKGARNAVRRHWNPGEFIEAGRTDYQVLAANALMSLRYYPPLSEETVCMDGQCYRVRQKRYATPLVLVPPLGVYAWIFDLLIERSLVRYMLAHGFEVYMIDWGAPTRDYAHIALEDYVCDWFPKCVEEIRSHSGSKELSLMGYCMGGLLSMLYLAWSEDKNVKNLITIASPIDVHHMGPAGVLTRAMRVPAGIVRKTTGFRLDRINPERFHVSAERLSVLFKMSNPLAAFTSYVDLLRNIWDDEYVTRYMTMNAWFNKLTDYPGGTVQDIVRKMSLYNRLAKGRIRIGGKSAQLKNIDCALLAFAGDNDKIVSLDSAKKIMDVVGSRDKSFHIVPGGHAGVFTGGRAAGTTWSISKNWLALRSRPVETPAMETATTTQQNASNEGPTLAAE